MKRLLATIAITVFLGCVGETVTGGNDTTTPPQDTMRWGDTLWATNIDTTIDSTHCSIKIYKNLHKKVWGGTGLWGEFKSSSKSSPISAQKNNCFLTDSESVWYVPDSTCSRIFKVDSTDCTPLGNWKRLEKK